MDKEVYIVDDLYANRDPRLYTECPTLRSERFGLKVVEEFLINEDCVTLDKIMSNKIDV